jgi:excisionase family DNA binding protein
MSREFAVAECVFSIPQAAAFLTVSRAFLYQLIARGSIKTVKIGGRTLVRGSELVLFLDSAQERAR